MNLEIANRLAALRREKGYSQEALARQLGVSRQAVSKWERGEAAPEMENLILLAGLFEVSLDGLLLGGGGAQTQAAHQEPIAQAAQTQTAPEKSGADEEDEDAALLAAAARWDAIEEGPGRARRARWRRRLLVFPYPVLVTAIFLMLGFFGGWWHPGWLIYLSIPIYYCAVADRTN